MSDAQTFAEQNFDRFKQQLVDLLKIPSISTLSEHAADVERAAAWLVADMQRIGLDRAQTFQKEGFLPIVYGEWNGAGEDAPTVMIYCHYDVQPAEIRDGWTTNPFDPTEKDGKLFARGTVDSKSHVMAHLKAVESLLASEAKSPCNIKLLFEGEEESGSEHIFAFVRDNPDLLQSDVIVVSDGSGPDVNQPVLEYGLRGIVTMQLEVTGPKRDLHSGHYGGSVHNPIQALAEIINQLHDQNGAVTVPGFYDDVRELTSDEREVLAEVGKWIEREWHEVTEAPQPWGEAEFSIHERIGARPTLEINGIEGGFYGEGFKTVLPSRAIAKISCRLVPDQNPERIIDLLKTHIESLTPPTVTTRITDLDMGAAGVVLEYDNPAMQALVRAYEKGWGVKPILSRAGGSVPVVAPFIEHLNAPVVLMPFGYKGCGAHGPNEHIYLEMWRKGIATAIHFYNEFAR